MGKTTDEMNRNFSEHRNGIDSFVAMNEKAFDTEHLSVTLSRIYDDINNKRKLQGLSKLKKNKIADYGNMTESVVYSLFNGSRSNPNRDTIIKLCFGMGLDPDTSNYLLRKCSKGEFYIRNERDCVILYFLRQFERRSAEEMLLPKCNEKLRELGLEEID